MKILLFLTLFILYPSQLIIADTIILKNGNVIKGKVTSQDEKQVFVTDKSGSTQKISKSDTVKVLYKDVNDKEVQDIIKEYQLQEKSNSSANTNENGEDAANKTKFIRFSGDLTLGYYETDWEKRLIFANLLGGRLESDWSGKLGLGMRLGGEYVEKLDNSVIVNYFAGLDISRYQRNYESSAVGFTFSNRKADANLNLFKIYTGFTWEIQPQMRLKPKLNIFRIQETLESSANNFGMLGTFPVLGNETGTINATGMTSSLSLLFEYDYQKDFTIFTELHLLSPLIFEDKGSFESKSQAFSATSLPSLLMQSGRSKGGYATTVSGISLGFNKILTSNVRFFAMYENLELSTKVTGLVGGTASIASAGTSAVPGFDVVLTSATQGTIYGENQPIRLQGIKAGVSIDLNLSK